MGNSCVAYLENQTVLSHKWILEAKQEYKVEFRILNNGKKLYFDKLDTESQNQDKKEEDPELCRKYADRGCQNFPGRAGA